ncbi:hypothetical protein [Dyadobacter aurulentus]|uniref:hypothetical protein n=1 Tax=Dyadobacter sp. UC 10 TaxID=2605428 RepID=UPI0011F239FB|nr:hypothetical protein [Dyadobacter sp. UC 10]KAA0992052.1 hypothetical protein FXO21_18670 [Dyadobacter sp. UC 10]
MKQLFLFILISLWTATISVGQNCTINAGVNSSICLGQPVVLDGSLGGPADPASIKWTLLSQPAGANATISNSSSLLTNVNNVSVIGTYTFRINAICGDGVAILMKSALR